MKKNFIYALIACFTLSLAACMGHRTKRILRIERKEYQTY